jgi:hypothetical protein
MKVAQHFSAGLAFLKARVPPGTIEYRFPPHHIGGWGETISIVASGRLSMPRTTAATNFMLTHMGSRRASSPSGPRRYAKHE